MRRNEGLEKLIRNFRPLEEKLKISFKDKMLLLSAFCHRSFLNETKLSLESYERLEFLGDAVLLLVITEYLYHFFPEKKEGELSFLKSYLVSEPRLAESAKKLGLSNYFLLSTGEEKSGGRQKTSLLADVFESFIGALYLDKGYKICQNFIEKNLILEHLEEIKKGMIKDAKTVFQERAQELTGITPVYKTLKEWGPDHDKMFLVAVFLGEEEIARAEGRSKKEAGEKAAQKALEIKNW